MSPWLSNVLSPEKTSISGVQALCWGRIFQPKSTLPIEIHGRLLAVLGKVTRGPAVVARQVPTLLVTGAIAATHQFLRLVHACRPRHEVLHGRHSKCGLATQDGLHGDTAAVGCVHHREGGATAILLCANVTIAAHGAEGQEGEGKHRQPGERVLEVVVADSEATGATAAAAATGCAHDAARWGRHRHLTCKSPAKVMFQ